MMKDKNEDNINEKDTKDKMFPIGNIDLNDIVLVDGDEESISNDDNEESISNDDNEESISNDDNEESISNDDNGNEENTDVDDDTVHFKFATTKHKLEGKHRLKRDTIFHGKLEEEEDDMYSSNSDYYNKDFPIEKGTTFENESINFEEMENQRKLKKNIYKILTDNTELDFTSNRRKPNKQAFNNYYQMLLDELENRYTRSEIFVELSYYFTDHIFNMYKLLYPEHATNIIMELRDKGYLTELDNMKFV